MVEVTRDMLGEMVAAIVAEVHPERIILFGSRARAWPQGPDAGGGSDLDLLIEESDGFGPHRTRWGEIRRIRRVLRRFRVPKDILVYSSDEVAKWRSAQNHVVASCLRSGKTLYERS